MNLADGNRVVLLTGARRIGAEVALEAARRGADIALAYRSSEAEAADAARAVRALGRRAALVRGDVADAASAAGIVAAVDREFGRLDVLVNMASLYRKVPYDALTVEEWHRQLSVDLYGTFQVAHAAVPLMRRTGGGSIVNFTDWVAASARPRYHGYLAYYVAKAGVKALTEALALELASDNILVNAIAPGPILPPDDLPEAEADAVTRSTPLGRWGGAGEVVKAVMALVESDFITGETIRVDGGRHLS
jgi:NAD(P)-dependent dehydrogenase (short-subunit alcohol dehydrogenase family)